MLTLYHFMQWVFPQRRFYALVFSCCQAFSLSCFAGDNEDVQEIELSAEFLEFLAEVGDADDETFELILYHGIEDSKDPKDTTEQEQKKESQHD